MSTNQALNLIQKGRLGIGRVSEFNDPFDCWGSTDGFMSDESCYNLISQNLDKWRRLLSKIAQCNLMEVPVEEIVDLVQCKMESDKSGVNSILNEAIKEWHIDTQYRVLCFCDADNTNSGSDILMWSHYANSSKGVRIEFEIDSLDLHNKVEIRPISYVDKLPVLDASLTTSWNDKDAEYSSYMRKCIFCKNKVWAYEHEYRMLLDLNNVKVGTEENRCDSYDYINVGLDCIKAITVPGMRFNEEHDQLIRYAKKSGIRTYIMDIYQREYRLSYKEI